MTTYASLREIHDSDCVFGAIIGNFIYPSTNTRPTICLQKRHALDLYSIIPGDKATFSFVLTYNINAKIRQLARIPLTNIDLILVWCEECKVTFVLISSL